MSRLLTYSVMQQKRKGSGFKTEWTVSGDATARTITLPLYNSGTFNCTVKWGDGTADSVVTAYNDADRIHTYASNGSYTVEITGDCPAWSFNNGGDKLKITDIIYWGDNPKFGGFSFITNGFYGCTNLKSPGTGSPTFSAGISVAGLFMNCTTLSTFDISDWTVSNITSFGTDSNSGMFSGCTGLTSIDLSGWSLNTTSSFTMGGLFYNCTNLTTVGDISSWNMAKCTNVKRMFQQCTKITNTAVNYTGSWNLSTCTDFIAMFASDTTITGIDLSGWTLNTTSNVSMYYMFYKCTNLTTIGDVSGWNTSKVTSTASMFNSCLSLTNTAVNYFGSLNFSNCTDFSEMLRSCTALTSINLSSITFNSSSNITLKNLFYGCTNLTTIGDVSGWNTSKFSVINGMFNSCPSLTNTAANYIGSWTVSNITNFGDALTNGVFSGCTGLTSIDLSGWSLNTTSSFTIDGLFYNCANLTTAGDISGWNMTKCTSIQYMFGNCADLTNTAVNYTGSWNLSTCTSFRGMFSGDTTLTSIDLSGWTLNTTTNVSMYYMFFGCTNLTTIGDVSGWNTTKLNNTNQMFDGCTAFTGTFKIPANTTVLGNYMFRGCALTRVDSYPSTAPTCGTSPFDNDAMALHVPTGGGTGYGVAPWTTTAIFSSITADL